MIYSIDLRQRVVDAYYADILTTYKQVAIRFNVSDSFVSSLLRTYRNTGSVESKVRQEQTPTKLSEKQLLLLKEVIKEDNDATLQELCKTIKTRTGVQISVSTMGRMTQKLNTTVKKNSPRQPKR